MQKMKGFVSIRYLMALLLGVVMFSALMPTIADQFWMAENANNVTGAAATIVGLGTLIVVIIVFAKLTKQV